MYFLKIFFLKICDGDPVDQLQSCSKDTSGMIDYWRFNVNKKNVELDKVELDNVELDNVELDKVELDFLGRFILQLQRSLPWDCFRPICCR